MHGALSACTFTECNAFTRVAEWGMCRVRPEDESITEIRARKVRDKCKPNFGDALTHGHYVA